MPTPAENPYITGPDRQSITEPEAKPEQLEIRFFEVVGAYRGTAPERALWRILLDLAVPRIATEAFRATAIAVAGRPVSPAIVVGVAWVIYSLANTAGLTRVPQHEIAHHARLDRKTARAAIDLLEYWRVIRRDRTSRRSAEVIAMNLGGLSWEMVRRRLRDARRNGMKSVETPALFPELSGGTVPPLEVPSGGTVPPPRAVRTGLTYTTTTTRVRARPPATDLQIAYAVDLGIDPDGKDLVQLGEEIETARTKRAAARTKSTSASGAHHGRLTPIERRRIREAQRTASPRPEKPLPAPETEAEAAERLRRGLANAEAHGFRRDPHDPDVLVGPGGRRVWCGALAQLDGRGSAGGRAADGSYVG